MNWSLDVGDHGGEDEAAAAAGAQRAAVGAAVAVGQDGVLPRLHARLAAARLRAAAAHRRPRPATPARAPLQLPPRREPPHLAHRPGQGLPLPVIARRPPRRLRRALPPHPLRVHGVRGRRGLPVGGRGVQRRLGVLRRRQGGRGVRRGARQGRAGAAGQGPARRRGGHVPHVARARRRAHRHGLPRQLPRATPPARLQNRRRSCKAKGRPNAQVPEAAVRRMTLAAWPLQSDTN